MRGSLWLGPQSERRGRAFQTRETSEAKVLCGMNGHAELKGITPGLLCPAPGKLLTVTPHGGLTPDNFIRVSENVVEASLFCKSPSSDSNAQLGGNDSHRK